MVFSLEAQRGGILKKLAGQSSSSAAINGYWRKVWPEERSRWSPALVMSSFLPFAKAGLPVKSFSTPRDEIYVSGGSGNVAIIKGAPHPNATKVFVNWFLGQQGQEVYSRAMGQATRRLDVDTVWLKEFGVVAAKDTSYLGPIYKIEISRKKKSSRRASRRPNSRASFSTKRRPVKITKDARGEARLNRRDRQ